MRKIIALIGVPGTGKTRITRGLMEDVNWEVRQETKLVNSHFSHKHNLHVLGKYHDKDEVFAGTDKLAMNVMPKAKEFISESKSNIYFEGDRLTSIPFFEMCSRLPNTIFKIIKLVAEPHVLEERYKIRGSEQDKKFLLGRQTKIGNVSSSLFLREVMTTYHNNTLEDMTAIVSALRGELLI